MKSVIKGAGYILVHTPDMVIHNGTTQTTERIVNPESEYLKELPGHIRSFEDVLSYYPNQVYIGNVTPDELAEVPQPWCDKVCPKNGRFGQFGQMMPQEEFLLLMQACDVFELVYLDKDFVAENKAKLAENPLIDETVMARVNDGIELSEIERLVSEEHSEGLYHHDKLVGCVKRAHDIDVNLSAHVRSAVCAVSPSFLSRSMNTRLSVMTSSIAAIADVIINIFFLSSFFVSFIRFVPLYISSLYSTSDYIIHALRAFVKLLYLFP